MLYRVDLCLPLCVVADTDKHLFVQRVVISTTLSVYSGQELYLFMFLSAYLLSCTPPLPSHSSLHVIFCSLCSLHIPSYPPSPLLYRPAPSRLYFCRTGSPEDSCWIHALYEQEGSPAKVRSIPTALHHTELLRTALHLICHPALKCCLTWATVIAPTSTDPIRSCIIPLI